MANIIDKQKEIITKLNSDTSLSSFNILDNPITEYRGNTIVVEPNGDNYIETNEGSVIVGHSFWLSLAVLTTNLTIQEKRNVLANAKDAVLKNIRNVIVTSEQASEVTSTSNKFSVSLIGITTT